MQNSSSKKIQLDYDSIKKLKIVLIVTSVTILLVLGVFYLHPSNIDWTNSSNFSFGNLLQFVFIDQYLIELITTYIIILGLKKYGNLFKIDTVVLTFKEVLLFFVKFIPFFLLIYFLTAPFSITIRYLYHYFITQPTTVDYFESYFFLNYNLYLAYLLPITVTCIILLSLVIVFSVKSHEVSNATFTFRDVLLTVKTPSGKKIVSSNHIEWVRKEGRKYFVKTENNTYQINKTLGALEEELDQNFISINRSTLINLAFFKEYSFWEHEKYSLRMTDGESFTITRQRLKVLKQRLEFYTKNTDKV